MKRKLLSMVTVGIMVLGIFTGCESSGDVTVQQNSSLRFQPTGNIYEINGFKWQEYVDTKTNNLYVVNTEPYHCGFSPLYDENGEIAKYKEK